MTATNSNPYDPPSVTRIAPPQTVGDTPRDRSSQQSSNILAVSVWQLACLVMFMLGFGQLVKQIVVHVGNLFLDYFDDVNHPAHRPLVCLMLLAFTLPASVLAIAVVERKSGSKQDLEQKLFTICCWQFATTAALMISYEVGFAYRIHQLIWWMFSFQNLIMHRMIAWLVCTTPPASIAVWHYSRLCEARSSGKDFLLVPDESSTAGKNSAPEFPESDS